MGFCDVIGAILGYRRGKTDCDSPLMTVTLSLLPKQNAARPTKLCQFPITVFSHVGVFASSQSVQVKLTGQDAWDTHTTTAAEFCAQPDFHTRTERGKLTMVFSFGVFVLALPREE